MKLDVSIPRSVCNETVHNMTDVNTSLGVVLMYTSTKSLHICCLQGQLCDPMPVVLTETENENDSANQNYVAKMILQK